MPELTVTWDDPAATIGHARSLSGLAWMQAIADGALPNAAIAGLMGMTVVEVEQGRCVFQVTPGPQHANPIGTVHGGLLATLLDSVTGCAVHTHLDPGVGYGTTDLHVRLLRVPAVGETITAEGRTVHVGRTLATAEGEARDPAGRLLGTATAGCAILRP